MEWTEKEFESLVRGEAECIARTREEIERLARHFQERYRLGDVDAEQVYDEAVDIVLMSRERLCRRCTKHCSFGAFLHSQVRLIALARRRRRRDAPCPAGGLQGVPERARAPRPRPSVSRARHWIAALLLCAAGCMSGQDMQILKEHYCQGRTWSEVGHHMHLSENAARSAGRRGVERLLAWAADHVGEPVQIAGEMRRIRPSPERK